MISINNATNVATLKVLTTYRLATTTRRMKTASGYARTAGAER
jgi:hypothetical protein